MVHMGDSQETSSPPICTYGEGKTSEISSKMVWSALTTLVFVKSTMPTCFSPMEGKPKICGSVLTIDAACPGTSISPMIATPRAEANACSSCSSVRL